MEPSRMPETINPVSITEETRRRYLNYALSVITSRALPDVRDGLKPVQRRILYTMYADLHLYHDGRPRKCAKIVGDVTGNYHPHGTIPAYDALVRMAQDFVMRMPLVKGPDFPLGGKVVTDRKTLRKIYEEGTGSIKVQAEWKFEEQGRREQIVVTSIPYGVNKGNLEGAIGEIIAARQLPQLLNLVNESNEKEGMRIVLETKPGTEPELVMAYRYKHTALQETFPYNMTCLVPGADGKLRPERLGLSDVLRHFLDFRFATVKRRFEYELEQLRKRIHILQGFRIIFNALDKAIKLI